MARRPEDGNGHAVIPAADHKVKKLAEKYPDQVQIDWENKDGSIVAHMPVSAISFRIVVLDEAAKEKARQNVLKALEARKIPPK